MIATLYFVRNSYLWFTLEIRKSIYLVCLDKKVQHENQTRDLCNKIVCVGSSDQNSFTPEEATFIFYFVLSLARLTSTLPWLISTFIYEPLCRLLTRHLKMFYFFFNVFNGRFFISISLLMITAMLQGILILTINTKFKMTFNINQGGIKIIFLLFIKQNGLISF